MMTTNDERSITHQLAGMVADEMADGWSVDTSDDLAEHRGAWFDGPDGARLFMSLDWRNGDRVTIAGTYPRNNLYDVPRFEIGVGRDRGPAVIAREIVRRLLPSYLPWVEKINQSLQNDVSARAARLELATTIAGIVGGTVDVEDDRSTNTRVRWFNNDRGYGHVVINYRADGISELEVRSSTPERILAALRALQA